METTALAALALIRSGRNPDTTRKALTWLTSQKDPNGDLVLDAGHGAGPQGAAGGDRQAAGRRADAERIVEVRLDGELIETLQIPADQADVLKQVDLSARLKPGKQTLTADGDARRGDRLPGVVPLQRSRTPPRRRA